MTTKEIEFQNKLRELFKEYGVTSIDTEYGYYDEQTPYVEVEGGSCRIYLRDLC